MSRCFPFPPPGYLKKTRTDEVDLLKKEKQKEKKHKKDKKDKEKRESKEKREKEGREGKHKEKKDKKEKREKKKDKEKSKDRDKSKISTADDKGFPRQVEGLNANNLHQKGIKQDDKKDIMFENRLNKQCTGSNGEKARERNHLAEENKDSKFLRELDRRIRDDNGGADNQFVHKFTNTNNRKDEGTFRFVAKAGGTRPDGNEKLMDKGIDVKKIDGRGIQAEVRPIGNTPVPNHTGNFHPRVDGIPKHLGKYFERNLEATVEGKEKVKEKKDEDKQKAKEKTEEGKVREKTEEGKVREKTEEGKVREKTEEGRVKEKKDEGKVKEKKDEGKEKVKEKKDDKRRDKRKDKEKEKKGHGKNKDRDKEKKKEEKAKDHNELKTTEQNKLKESNKIGHKDSNSFTQLPRNILEDTISGENLKKRKDIESNGIPRVNDSFPNKFPKLSSSHSSDNGRILEPCQISTPDPSYRSQVPTGVKVENKECKINGIIETRSFSASSNKTHTAIVSIDFVTEAYVKPPHPDTKYLDQVYSVPKVDHWSDFDEEWLFGGNFSSERKSVVKSSEVGDAPQVWAEALHIEPADVFALPYVIPY